MPADARRSRRHERRAPRPLTGERARELALSYAARFATSRVKLERYLARKLAEGGPDESDPPDIAAIVGRLVDLGYVDDAAFAAMTARSLDRRGYGHRRVDTALRAAGIGDDDRADTLESVRADDGWAAALRYARRKRAGPFAAEQVTDPAVRQKLVAAFVRAGHDVATARAIIALAPGADVGDESPD